MLRSEKRGAETKAKNRSTATRTKTVRPSSDIELGGLYATSQRPTSWQPISAIMSLLNETVPRFVMIPACIFFSVFYILAVLTAPYLSIRTKHFNAIMPQTIADANLVPTIIRDCLRNTMGCCLICGLLVVLVVAGLKLFGLTQQAHISRHQSIKSGWSTRIVRCAFIMMWLVAFDWFFTQGFMAAGADLMLNAKGGMFWQNNWPTRWSSDERLDVPEDLDRICPTEQSCNQTIEKIIHQTYKTEELPAQWKDTPRIWKEMHPNWEYKFWTDKSMREFIAAHYSWFLETYDNYEYPIERADAIRYFAVYHYGGIYADMDLQPRENVGRLLSGTDVAVFETPNMGLTNMAFAAKKHSPFLRCVLAQLPIRHHQLHHKLVQLRGWWILSSTGPTFWWAMAGTKMCGKSFMEGERLRTVSSEFMGRCNLCDGSLSGCQKVGVLKHLVGSSWVTASGKVTHFLWCRPGVAVGLLIVILKAMQLLYQVRCRCAVLTVSQTKEIGTIKLSIATIALYAFLSAQSNPF